MAAVGNPIIGYSSVNPGKYHKDTTLEYSECKNRTASNEVHSDLRSSRCVPMGKEERQICSEGQRRASTGCFPVCG